MARVKRGVWHGTARDYTFGLPADGREYIPEQNITKYIYEMLGKNVRRVNTHGVDVENPALAFPDVNNPMHTVACKLQSAWLREITTAARNGTLQKRGRHVS